MKLLLTINREFHNFMLGKNTLGEYLSSTNLIREAESRGHEVYVVPPTEFREEGSDLVASHYKLTESKGLDFKFEAPPNADVCLVRSLGEDATDQTVATNFTLNYLSRMNGVRKMVNSSSSTAYEHKPTQKTLDLPFIEGYPIRSTSNLTELLNDGIKLIAKPVVGQRGAGVEYLDKIADATLIPEDKLEGYCFEKFVPDRLERRYFFLDGEVFLSRDVHKTGPPGREDYGKRSINTQWDPQELDVVNSAIEQTEMDYGCVDFRGGYVLEINGSGTGTHGKDNQGNDIYNFAPKLIDHLESRASE
jgi:glutathione synthase/RimK-type ligase-like ATP-grasp enzyme